MGTNTHKLFQNYKNQISKIIENQHFGLDKETKVKCDANAKGLGECLEQKTDKIWHTIAFLNQFSNALVQRYSRNNLELLAVVWSLEHLKYHLLVAQFTLQTDH